MIWFWIAGQLRGGVIHSQQGHSPVLTVAASGSIWRMLSGSIPVWLLKRIFYDSLLKPDVSRMDFTIVILNEYVSSYSDIAWVCWKDHNRQQMKSQGDHWSMATLKGNDVWDCLAVNNIDPCRVVQWKPADESLHRVSLPSRSCTWLNANTILYAVTFVILCRIDGRTTIDWIAGLFLAL